MLSLGLSLAVGRNRGAPAETEIAPVNLTVPVMTAAVVGDTVACSDGTWSGVPAPVITKQFKLDGTNIPASYEYASGDVDKTVTCVVTATNSAGAASETASGVTVTPALAAPANTVLPVVTDPVVGNTPFSTNGTWTGYPTPTYAKQFKLDGVDIASSYTLLEADVGKSLTCTVTATNSSGSSQASSTGKLVTPAPAAPVNTALPVLSPAVVGGTPACTNGTWTGYPEPSYAQAFTLDGGPIASDYVFLEGDIGLAVVCTVTATNASGSDDAIAAAVLVQAA